MSERARANDPGPGATVVPIRPDHEVEREYRKAVWRQRLALLTGSGLSGTDRQIALIMLEWVNHDAFIKSGELVSWLGEDKIAAYADLSPSTVRRSRRQLRDQHVVTCSNKGGRNNSARYFFNHSWAEAAFASLEKRKIDVEENRRTSAPLSEVETRANLRPFGTERGASESVKGRNPAQKGAQSCTERGADLHPEPFDITLREEPIDKEGTERTASAVETKSTVTTTPTQPALLLPLGGRKDSTLEGAGGNQSAPARKPRHRHVYSEAFEAFWQQYPARGRVDKPKCSAKFERLIRDKEVTVDELMGAVAIYGASRKVADGFICNMMTWLNGERWTVVEAPATDRKGGGKPSVLDSLKRMAGND